MTHSFGPLLVTGANGFVGGALCDYLAARGHTVRALVRRPAGHGPADAGGAVQAFRFDLSGDIDERAFEQGATTVIHCAWAMQGRGVDALSLNLKGFEALQNMAARHACRRTILISSLAAHDGALSAYGRGKLAAEGRLDPASGLALRPGLVIGNGGLFARLRTSISRLPLVPLFYGGNQRIQHIAIADLCLAVERALERGLTGNLDIAHPEPSGIRAFYSAVAASVGRRCRFARLPGAASLAMLRGLERLRFPGLPVTSENLLGLKEMRVFDTAADLARLGVETMDLYQAIARAGLKKKLSQTA